MVSSSKAWRVGAIALLAGIITAFASGEAFADGKRYPASMCVPWGGPRPILIFSSLMAVKPPCTHPSGCPDADQQNINFVDCPIVKDNPLTGTNRVQVIVVDNHRALDIKCWVTSVVWNGSTFLDASDQRSSSGATGQPQTLAFGPQLPAVSSGTESHWYISCGIPPGSSLISYFVDELNE
ncbi:MAG: hypothetical protein WAS73_07075 [Defluviicoccus sp.]